METGTGVHAAAVINAFKKSDVWLANCVDSGVPADKVSFARIIEFGPMSANSSAIWFLEKLDVWSSDNAVEDLFALAKTSPRPRGRKRRSVEQTRDDDSQAVRVRGETHGA